jgi:hypothetical protein
MLKIEHTDIQPLADFPLSWRWTDPKWNRLPDSALQQISPLTQAKAKELWRISGHFVLPNGPKVDMFECSSWVDATVDTPDAFGKVRGWLLGRLSDREQRVIVSWDKDIAVVTNWGVFCDYWNDFCYPASDDTSVFPQSFDWVLFYQHGERFVFGQKRATAA